jgi:hypothetical protein
MNVSYQIGQLGAAARDMAMAATLEGERRVALERHAVDRFWKACGMHARKQGLEPLRPVRGEG